MTPPSWLYWPAASGGGTPPGGGALQTYTGIMSSASSDLTNESTTGLDIIGSGYQWDYDSSSGIWKWRVSLGAECINFTASNGLTGILSNANVGRYEFQNSTLNAVYAEKKAAAEEYFNQYSYKVTYAGDPTVYDIFSGTGITGVQAGYQNSPFDSLANTVLATDGSWDGTAVTVTVT